MAAGDDNEGQFVTAVHGGLDDLSTAVELHNTDFGGFDNVVRQL